MRTNLLILSLLFTFGVPVHAVTVSRSQQLMGTLCEITAQGTQKDIINTAITQAFAEIHRLEKLMSTYIPTSEISQFNSRNEESGVKVSKEVLEVVKKANEISRMTQGTFDITLMSNGYQELNTDDETQMIQSRNGNIKIDLGAIGKGYALDKAALVLKKAGIKAARLNFSGNILVFGPDPWPIQLPNENSIDLKNASISTSSQQNKPGHIINPKTGKPINNSGSISVTAKTATEADALSTALFVMGKSKAKKFLNQYKNEYTGTFN